jgi:hypothetical protein
MEQLGWLALAHRAWNGLDVAVQVGDRDIGQPEKAGVLEPAADKRWPSAERGGSGLELTREPVKVRKSSCDVVAQETEGQERARAFSEPGEILDALVVGGAASGLAVSACLAKKGLRYVCVEKNEHNGDIWRSRYHRLHLHDIIEACHLPFFDMPTSFPVYPSRERK